eukprot:PITA_18693
MASTSVGMFNTQLPQFNGKNYDYWDITMKVVFASQDLWEFVEYGFEEPANEEEFNELTQAEKELLKSNKKKDSKALVFLYQAVHESVFPRIAAAKTSREAWKTLKTAYQGMERVKTTKLQLLRKDFENLRMKESDNIDSFFTQAIGLVTQIRSHGETLEERRIVEKLLRVLPSKFDVIVTTIEETKDLSNFSVDELHASLITHEQRLSRNENSSLEQAFKTQMSFGRGRGQGSGNKRGRGKSQNRGGRNNPANAQGRGSNPNQNQGHGSSQQSDNIMLKDKGNISMFSALDQNVKSEVTLGTDSKISVMGKGEVKIFTKKGEKKTIADVYYVPGMRCNLLSIGQLVHKGYNVFFKNDVCTIMDIAPSKRCIVEVKMIRNVMFPLRIRADLKNKEKDLGLFSKNKSEVFEKFRNFKALVENQSGLHIKVLRTDRGGEYISKEFLWFCRENGIHKQLARYTPQQIGVAERKNRTIMDMARSMLKGNHFPNDYWAEGVNCAAYILNRCPTKAVMNRVPEEAWSGRKQGVTHMKIFGCVAYAHIPD